MGNAFETGQRRMVPAVLVYARAGTDVLMLERGARPGDVHAGKWNGVGGKCEADEPARDTAAREFHEEAGVALAPERFRALGVLHFPCFKPARCEDWLVHVFTATLSPAERAAVPARSPEGTLHWVPATGVLSLPLWAGDHHFLPWVLLGRPFTGTFFYVSGELARHELHALGG